MRSVAPGALKTACRFPSHTEAVILYGLGDRWRTLTQKPPSAVLNSLLDIFIPPVCVLCRVPGKVICEACLEALPRVGTPFCLACGRPSQQARSRCHTCKREDLPLRQIRAPLLYDQNVPRLMHHFKYKHKRTLAEPLGRLMVDVLSDLSQDSDLIVPLPLHKGRERQRGYNQAQLLAKVVGKGMNRPVQSAALTRIRATAPQAKLAASERAANTANAFQADPNYVYQQQILLIDDVCTTGATLASATQALYAAGAHSVIGLCAARAP